jgi:hypothetical protein
VKAALAVTALSLLPVAGALWAGCILDLEGLSGGAANLTHDAAKVDRPSGVIAT